MKRRFQKYYRSEIQNAWMRILAGSFLGIGVGITYFWIPNDLISGIWWSIAAISAYQIGRGLKKLFRTLQRKLLLPSAWEATQDEFIQTEILFLQKRMSRYKRHRNIEILIITAGIFLSLTGAFGKWGYFMIGTGIGLAIQGSISLYLELVAEWSAGIFLNRLSRK